QAVEDAAQRPVREPLTVWQTLGDRHRGARLDRWQAFEEFFEEPGLPHAGGGNDTDQERPQLVEGPTRNQLQLLQVRGTADQRAARRHREGCRSPQQRQCPDRLGLASRVDRDYRPEFEPRPDAGDGPLATEDPPGLRRLLQPGGYVHGVAAEREVAGGTLPRGDDFASVDPETDRESVAQAGVTAHPVAERER